MTEGPLRKEWGRFRESCAIKGEMYWRRRRIQEGQDTRRNTCANGVGYVNRLSVFVVTRSAQITANILIRGIPYTPMLLLWGMSQGQYQRQPDNHRVSAECLPCGRARGRAAQSRTRYTPNKSFVVTKAMFGSIQVPVTGDCFLLPRQYHG
jgi:hypothetical protein